MAQPIKNPIFPFNRVAQRFFQQTINQLEVNTMTQRIYPKEVYNGYANILNVARSIRTLKRPTPALPLRGREF